MVLLRKWLILIHRYLGIGIGLLFIVWFISGIAMMYAGGMPGLTPELRRERLSPLEIDKVNMTPEEAVQRAQLGSEPSQAVLVTVMGRPAYRFVDRGVVTVFADDGEVVTEFGRGQARDIARRFVDLPADRLRHAGVLDEADQWTLVVRGQLPAHKFIVDDSLGTEVYVSEQAGEVVMSTTARSRAVAWVAAIPHWFYFAPLRLNDAVWRQTVLWAAGLGCVVALAGLVLAVLQFAPSRPFRMTRILSYVPYRGWMRWHYLTGVVFGVFSLTWVFSGMLSMEPFFWSSGRGVGGGVRQTLAGGPLDMALFPSLDANEWRQALPGQAVKEVEFLRLQGDPYYVVHEETGRTSLMRTSPFELRREPFSAASLMERVREAVPDVPIVSSQMLGSYDSYYYARGSEPPLPVLRIKFDDLDRTWLYIDPARSQLVARHDRLGRLERWIYNGFHSLDFSFWYDNRPLWDIGIIILSLGGIGSSAIGLFFGIKRLYRGARRLA